MGRAESLEEAPSVLAPYEGIPYIVHSPSLHAPILRGRFLRHHPCRYWTCSSVLGDKNSHRRWLPIDRLRKATMGRHLSLPPPSHSTFAKPCLCAHATHLPLIGLRHPCLGCMSSEFLAQCSSKCSLETPSPTSSIPNVPSFRKLSTFTSTWRTRCFPPRASTCVPSGQAALGAASYTRLASMRRSRRQSACL